MIRWFCVWGGLYTGKIIYLSFFHIRIPFPFRRRLGRVYEIGEERVEKKKKPTDVVFFSLVPRVGAAGGACACVRACARVCACATAATTTTM